MVVFHPFIISSNCICSEKASHLINYCIFGNLSVDRTPKEDSLQRPLNLDELNLLLWSDKCDYVYTSKCTNLNPHNYNLVVLQHNVRSLPCNISETKLLLQTLHDKNSSVDIMLLCETFLNKSTAKGIEIPGYTLVSNYRQNHKGGGTSVLINDGIPFRRRQDLDVFKEKHTESTFVEISLKNGTPVVIGSLYRTPNTPAKEFIDNTSDVIQKIRCEGEKKRKNSWNGP